MKNIKTLILIFITTSFLFANENLKEGKQLFDKWCISCHGENMPATKALAIVYKGTGISPIIEKRDELNKEFVKYVVRYGRFSMPFFRKVEINDKELENLAEYLYSKK
ncbi:MAG TPA: cytochrome c [Aliarcobacter thereius]|uniref:c-type cytochrome n=1 Tax=Aliarcobacter thereius TaxID=544718 RepID=UPI0008251ED2|nr:cytochrome c [Aliarcobacter thereius]OCL93926.1 4-cresol dehydrogenase [hydroxylating] cytochrome c subunit precursor [Aliarcobacter thereius]HJE03874.1 cytochrome c [Aliarcobacter thereius]